MIELLKDIYLPLWIALVGGVLILIVKNYMERRGVEKSSGGFRVLRFHFSKRPFRTLIISLLVVGAANLLSSLVEILVHKVSSAEVLSGRTPREATLNALVFGFLYYLGFGSLSFVIHQITGEPKTLTSSIAQGHNSAFIAGAVVYPLQLIGQIASRVLAPFDPSSLYALEWDGMLALYPDAGVKALGFGLLVASLFVNASRSDVPIVQIYRNQNRILLIVLAICSFGPAFAIRVNPGSLFAKSLLFNNVFVVWYAFLLVSVSGYVIGSWIFTACLDQLLFSNIRDDEQERPASGTKEDGENRAK